MIQEQRIRRFALRAGLLFLATFSVSGLGLSAAQPEQHRYAEVLRASHLAAGFAVVTPAGDGSLALGLASQPGWTVLVADADPGKLKGVQAAAAAAGVLGKTLFTVQAASDSLPVADFMVDLCLLQGRDLECSERLRQEVVRILSPVRGAALVLDGPPPATLQDWMGPELGKTVKKVEEGVPAFAPWMIRRLPLPGSDWWTHRMHDAGNNTASTDTALRLPIGIQYLATPLQTSFQGVALTGNGRHIEITDSSTKNGSRFQLASRLRARSIYNGTILWEKPLPKGYEPDFPTAALQGDLLLLAHPDRPAILLVDTETGEVTETLSIHENQDARIHWIGVEGDYLAALLGPPFPKKKLFQYIKSSNKEIEERSLLGFQVMAVDLTSRQPLWAHREEGSIDYRNIALRDRQVVFFQFGAQLACLDDTGKKIWTNQEPDWIKAMRSPAFEGNLNTQSSPMLTMGPSHARLASHRGAAFFFSRADGRMTAPTSGPSFKGFFLGDSYQNATSKVDPDTGKPVGTATAIGRYASVGGCGLVTWIPGLDAGISHTVYGFKSPCGIGTWSAGGALLINPSHCDCSTGTVRGASAFLPVGDLYGRATKHPEHPLTTFATLPATFPSESELDWTHYLGGSRHSSATAASVSHKQPIVTTYRPDHPIPIRQAHDLLDATWYDRPTPAVTLGEMAFFTDSTGQITALDLATGMRRWTRHLGGPVFGSPVAHRGMLFIPGGDGFVHAVSAADGTPVWSWRAAPVDRRLMVFGKLSSSWPVISLLVEKDRIYGIGGLSQTLGSILFSLDPASGAVHWTQFVEPDFRSGSVLPRDVFAPGGHLAMVGDKLWVRSDYVVGVFDAKSGRRVPQPPELEAIWKEEVGGYMGQLQPMGQDIIQISDDLILQGGQSLFDDTSDRRTKRQSYTAFAPAKDGSHNFDAILPLPFAIENVRSSPASDYVQMAVIGGRAGDFVNIGLSFWDIDAWRRSILEQVTVLRVAAAERFAKNPANQGGYGKMLAAKAARWAHLPTNPGKAFLDFSRARWEHPGLELNAVVLTPDAVLAAHGTSKKGGRTGRHPGFESWHLSAFARADGTELWRVDLPSEPIYNGISVSASGQVVVIHRDGSATILTSDTPGS
jgi:outer membrane protein assembly factor BamB